MTKIKLRFLSSDTDRHGNRRYYVWIPDRPKVRILEPLLDEAGAVSEEFMAAYRAAVDGGPKQIERDQSRSEGTFNWLVDKYYRSSEFQDFAPSTQVNKKRHFEAFLRVAGGLPYRLFRQEDALKSRYKRKATPAEADNFIKALKRLMNWAIENKFASNNPFHKVGKIHNSQGHHTWTRAEQQQYRRFHPLGTTARLAFELYLSLGTRRSDAALVGPQHEDRGCLVFIAQKNHRKKPTEVVVVITPELREAIAATKTGATTFLVTAKGKPFSPDSLGTTFKKWCIAASLPHCSAHGLRKAAVVDHAESGASVDELKAMFGWRKSETAEIYTRAAQKRTLAQNAAQRRKAREEDR